MSLERDQDQRRALAALDLAATGERDAPIEIVEYDDAWPNRFTDEIARLAPIAPTLELHHIGSTAVPGLPAKPIIDMMAIVEDLDAPLPTLIERARYQYPVAYNAVLIGRRWLCYPSAAARTHHLHLVSDRDELARHLRFRDALRADPQLAVEYAEHKRALATRMRNDREGYTAAKTAFIHRVEATFRPAVIRAAGKDDAAAVLGLWDQARSPAAVTPDTEEALAALIEHPGSVLLMAELDHRIVGSLVVAWDGWRGNMYRLAVLPGFRRQGIARRLAEAGHDHLRLMGAGRVTALVAHEEEEAVGLWLSAGYERDEQVSRFVWNL